MVLKQGQNLNFNKFKKLIEKEFWNLNIYVKLTILVTENKKVIHVKRNLSDFKIQLVRKIRADVLSLYRKMSSLGATDSCKIVVNLQCQNKINYTALFYFRYVCDTNNPYHPTTKTQK